MVLMVLFSLTSTEIGVRRVLTDWSPVDSHGLARANALMYEEFVHFSEDGVCK